MTSGICLASQNLALYLYYSINKYSRQLAHFKQQPATSRDRLLFDLLLQFVKNRRAEKIPQGHVQPVAQLLDQIDRTSLRRPSSILYTVEGVTPER